MEVLKWIGVLCGVSLMVLGIVNTLLMFETLGRRGAPGSLRSLHRWLGRIFVFVAVVMFVYMIPRIGHIGQFSVSETFHAVLGLALLPLIVWKILIVRRYKSYMGILPALGFTIMVVTFVAITLTSGPVILSGLSHGH
ncbi:DUF6529 family protein [Thermodesulfobacteriota bacterium]